MDQFTLHRPADGEVVLTCRGDLDLATRADLGAACCDALGLATRALCIDLDGVDFLDCGSIRLIDQAAVLQGYQGGDFAVVCHDDFLRRVLRLTGFSARHELVPSVPRAETVRSGTASWGRLSWRVPAPPSARRAAR